MKRRFEATPLDFAGVVMREVEDRLRRATALPEPEFQALLRDIEDVPMILPEIEKLLLEVRPGARDLRGALGE